MRIRPASAAAGFALSSLVLTGLAAPSLAQTPVCDPYSNVCPPEQPAVAPTTADRTPETAAPETAAPGTAVRDRSASDVQTLPFTGGELVLLTAVGAGALAGGIALVAAGRRRKPDFAA